MRHPPLREMNLDSPALCAEKSRIPNQTRKEPRLLDGTRESPQEHCQKTRRTLMSPQECKIAQCTTNQLEMKPISHSLAP